MDLVVGRVVKAHGISGEVVVDVRTDDPDARFAPGARLRGFKRNGPQREFVIDSVREHGNRLLVRLAGVTDRNSADEVRGTVFVVDAAELPPIEDPDEFYDHQLVGLSVEDASGAARGTVTAVEHTGGQDLLHIDVDGADVLFPFVAALVPVVDVPGGRIVVDDRPGLLRPESP